VPAALSTKYNVKFVRSDEARICCLLLVACCLLLVACCLLLNYFVMVLLLLSERVLPASSKVAEPS